jgi:hypothetical protein
MSAEADVNESDVSSFMVFRSIKDPFADPAHGCSYTVVRSIQPGRSGDRAKVEVRIRASPGGAVSMIVQPKALKLNCGTLGQNFTSPLAKVI